MYRLLLLLFNEAEQTLLKKLPESNEDLLLEVQTDGDNVETAVFDAVISTFKSRDKVSGIIPETANIPLILLVDPEEFAEARELCHDNNSCDYLIVSDILQYDAFHQIENIINSYHKVNDTFLQEHSKMNDLLVAMNIYYVELTKDAIICGISSNIDLVTGVEQNDMIGKPLWDFIVEDEYSKQLRELLQKGDSVVDFDVFLETDPELIPCSLNLYYNDNKYTGVIRDVRFRNDFVATSAQLSAIIDCSDDAIINKTVDGVIKTWNKGAERMFGYKASEVMGKHVTMLEVANQDDTKHIFELLQNGVVIEAYEDLQKCKNGNIICVSKHIFPVTNSSGNTVGTCTIMRDISEQKRIEEKILQIQKIDSLGILAGGIAHDFNNLLMVVLSNAEMALSELPEFLPARDMILDIKEAARRATDLSKQMLAYSGRGPMKVENIEVAPLVTDIVNIIKSSLSRNLKFAFNIGKNVPMIKADPTQLRQAIVNLVTNAAEAIDTNKGTIEVAINYVDLDFSQLDDNFFGNELQAGKYVKIIISDNGPGMDDMTLKRIFDPFFTTKTTGRGLGLAAVFGVVKAHGGAIHAESCQNLGTKITIILPPVEDKDKVKGKAAPKVGKEVSKGSVLLVDDEEIVRKVTSMLLQKLGFKVITASNGREGVDVIERGTDDVKLVLLDLSMPEMHGLEALHLMRQIKPELPVILVSGFDSEDASHDFTSEKPNDFIQKPYPFELLRQKVLKVLGDI